MNTRTHRHTDTQTNWLVEGIGPEGRCFENPAYGRHWLTWQVRIVALIIRNPIHSNLSPPPFPYILSPLSIYLVPPFTLSCPSSPPLYNSILSPHLSFYLVPPSHSIMSLPLSVYLVPPPFHSLLFRETGRQKKTFKINFLVRGIYDWPDLVSENIELLNLNLNIQLYIQETFMTNQWIHQNIWLFLL